MSGVPLLALDFRLVGIKHSPFNLCIDNVKCNLIGLYYSHWPMKTHRTWLRGHENKTPILSHGLTITKYMRYNFLAFPMKKLHCHSLVVVPWPHLSLALPFTGIREVELDVFMNV